MRQGQLSLVNSLGTDVSFIAGNNPPSACGLGLELCARFDRPNRKYSKRMEGAEGAGAPRDEPQADGAAVSDSFSQLWTDVMGMLVSFWGEGCHG